MEPLKRNNLVFTAVLLGLLFLRPFLSGPAANWIFLAAIVFSAWVVSFERPGTRRILVVVAAAVAAAILIVSLLPIEDRGLLTGPDALFIAILVLSFLIYCCFVVCRALILAEEVTGAEIMGSINLYLLLGFAWAYIYLVAHWFDPESFNIGTWGGPADSRFVYFSFVTLASLGYGDITPLAPFARMLSVLEAVLGEMYVALVVAYLLGIHIDEKLKAE
jgi:hypothetical protein